MAKHFFIDRNEALDALDEALEPSPEMWDTIRTTLRELPFVQAVEITEPTLMNAAEAIKKHCNSQKSCDGCCFYKEYGDENNSNKACYIGCPENWDISSIEQKWRTLHERA